VSLISAGRRKTLATAASDRLARLAMRQFSDSLLALAMSIWISISGCASPDRIAIELPPSVDLIALLELGRDDLFAAASGLVPWNPATGRTFFTHDRAEILVGYAREKLAGLGAPSDDRVLESDRLSLAGPCVRILPTPEIALRIDPSEVQSPVDPRTLPPLTAAWLGTSTSILGCM
jgi:hypothetical protein